MKFWQLVSITRDDSELITRVAATRSIWKKYTRLMKSFSDLVKHQDRTFLDTIVDTNFVEVVLEQIGLHVYLSSDGWLRSWRMESTDKEMALVDAFRLYGSDIVEAVCERGAIQMSK